MSQIPFLVDLVEAAVAFFGGCLFLWWWFVIRQASSVYAATTVCLFGFCLQNAVGVYARHKIAADPSIAADIAAAWWFVGRDILTFGGLAAIVVIMTSRMLKSIRWLRVRKLCMHLTRKKGSTK